MSRDELLEFIGGEGYAVQASVSALGSPQAAIVGIVVSDRFEQSNSGRTLSPRL